MQTMTRPRMRLDLDALAVETFATGPDGQMYTGGLSMESCGCPIDRPTKVGSCAGDTCFGSVATCCAGTSF